MSYSSIQTSLFGLQLFVFIIDIVTFFRTHTANFINMSVNLFRCCFCFSIGHTAFQFPKISQQATVVAIYCFIFSTLLISAYPWIKCLVVCLNHVYNKYEVIFPTWLDIWCKNTIIITTIAIRKLPVSYRNTHAFRRLMTVPIWFCKSL